MKSSLDIRSKLSLITPLLFVSLLSADPLIHSGLFAFVMVAGIFAGVSLRHLFAAVVPLLPILVMVLLFAGFDGFVRDPMFDRSAIIWQSNQYLVLTVDGLQRGLTFSLRLINMVITTKLLLSTTHPEEFMQLFQKARFPNAVTFALTVALRFIPELEKKRRTIIEAQTARGADFNSGSFVRRYYGQISIMLPLFVNAIVIADTLASALLIRGYGFQDRWTNLHEMKLTRKDMAIITIGLLISISCVGFKIAAYI